MKIRLEDGGIVGTLSDNLQDVEILQGNLMQVEVYIIHSQNININGSSVIEFEPSSSNRMTCA
jgi:hypothetical protein